MNPEALTDTELERLDELLECFSKLHSPNVEQLDGFLAALVCGPEQISQDEYLRAILGEEISENAFEAQPELQELISLVAKHRNFIDHTLRSGEVFTPLILADEKSEFRANDWANGFLRGTELRKVDWLTLTEDDENGGLLVPILALAYEHHADPEMRPYKGPISPERREQLIVGAVTGVMQIYHYFEAQRLIPSLRDDSTTYRRMAPKVGRNEQCPCGSGKKFKHCCGKVTLH